MTKPVPRSPKEVSVLVTARCNLACRHCSVYGDGPIEGDLPLDEWRAILAKLAQWKVLKLTVSGGEPMVREDFVELVREMRALPFRLSVNTNATLVTDEVARALSEARPRLESVMVSLDGARPETHDAQRGPGVFERMAGGVERLLRAGVPVGFYCTVTALNLGEVEGVARWALSRGERIQFVKFNDVLCVGRACTDGALGLRPSERREAGRRVAALADELGPRVTGTLLDMHRFAEDILAGRAKPYPQGSRGCGAMRGRMSVWPDGRVTPCDRIPHFTVGNARTEELPAIWRSSASGEFRALLATPICEVEGCAGCEYLAYCTGGCPVLPMREDWSGRGVLGRDPMGCVKAFIGEEVACG